MVDFRGVNYVNLMTKAVSENKKPMFLKMDCLFGKTSIKNRST